MPLPRNPVIRAGAILRKGGVHEKSASAQRSRIKHELDNEADEYLQQRRATPRAKASIDKPSQDAGATRGRPADHSHRWLPATTLPFVTLISLRLRSQAPQPSLSL